MMRFARTFWQQGMVVWLSRIDTNRNVPGRATAPALPVQEVEGNYECHVCQETVDMAKYDPNVKRLIWQCGTGHVSSIEMEFLFG